jgi:sugar phosphate isomerase/epimerase
VTILAYVEHCLPGRDPAARIATARRLGLALEVANREEADLEAVRGSGVPVVTVQAHRLHEAHPLHPDPACRDAAAAHVRDTIEVAAALGAGRVLTACGFGERVADRPFDRCVEFFSALAAPARGRGVRVLIELLSPLRAGAMTDPEELASLLDTLDAPDVFGAAIDTGHLLDAGREPEAFLDAWGLPVEEFQLRGPGSTPPPAEPIGRWLAALDAPPAVVAVEHREPVAEDALDDLVHRIATALTGPGETA